MPELPTLSTDEVRRYARHLSVPGVGEEGQRRLKGSSVLMIGTGGLGSPAALYLAAAGIGRIGLIDPDTVDRSNLQRQILHGESWVGKSKLESAAARLREVNPHVELELHSVRFTPENAMDLVSRYDVVLDGCDNFPTRFLSNDACFLLKKPCVYGSIFRFDGQVTVFAPHLGGPCYRCMLPSLPAPGSAPSCEEAGVLGVLPGVIGSLQAMETIKLLLGIGEPPLGKLLCYDALSTSFRSLRLRRDPACRLCGDAPTIHSVSNHETMANPSCEVPGNEIPAIDVAELSARINAGEDLFIIDVRQPEEEVEGTIPGAILIPLATLPERLSELPVDRELLIHCRSGGRSGRAVQFLHESGFPQAVNVAGGINAWNALKA
ncbi:molybdopterin-synthase adenylyltransferase MoeB [Luteolibacter sp. GHJ8]|uniref:Molybdopterin-synthase adenylyltransferase MoeB n=1 Tax=Luteolibacter rhizosphaerae TaxID=2989719 RepID=A0ABT3G868_9BACT|nr:molybdopterin-synthase adenylyltransferase MoeB [Luteolibacter rhizosphaerae]MCW1915691.1 molybdopterin-synthase adenylyltransferase MoeB [Luteolibacter rhizosphaerae]